MINKKPVKGGKFVSVTFRSGAPEQAKSVQVLGQFNGWDQERHPMKKSKDGCWSATIRMPKQKTFQFRYLIDGEQWRTDTEGDGLAINEFGGQNAVLET